MPVRRRSAGIQLSVSALMHVVVAAALALTAGRLGSPPPSAAIDTKERVPIEIPRLVFVPAATPVMAGGGGGGGGNRQAGPIRHAEGIGHDRSTVRVATSTRVFEPSADSLDFARDNGAMTSDTPVPLPGLVLDARPLASGVRDVMGLPIGGVSSGTSTGPGSGGGVGDGEGSGIGSGSGPGIGPGSGGGTGGGVYRPGGSVTAPKLLVQIVPGYTSDALNRRIQGTVVLEVIVTSDGRAGRIRVVRSLDAHGLDEEAVKAVGQWRFDPGRRNGLPVDVLVTILVDFNIR